MKDSKQSGVFCLLVWFVLNRMLSMLWMKENRSLKALKRETES